MADLQVVELNNSFLNAAKLTAITRKTVQKEESNIVYQKLLSMCSFEFVQILSLNKGLVKQSFFEGKNWDSV